MIIEVYPKFEKKLSNSYIKIWELVNMKENRENE